ncbi:rhomboid family intramembrane serine protease [Flagellimonas taeanensis]|uniref:rhomboid family intramembrane serine protease n=1 Tax=Flavobacteriaceae TaxID=49546 RepID=UPI000E68B104|nr:MULTISPECIES: rhomboid family intramembrane serine protease [Allomuricauda]MDC6385982.1 rhomboid family intramembrane serine protease [Muricauda sp. SK9]RIV50225.1 rhomboid family intramembrane serine protease [Allomuricauda taeanensis]
MELSKPYKFSQSVVLAPLLAVLVIWTVFWAEVRFGINLNEYGIYPRTISGLKGVVLSPFIHGSVEHLYNNTVPLAVLSSFLFYFYRKAAFRVLLLGILLSGFITWVIGRPSYHIGASGVIYVLSSFIFFKGIFAKHYRLVALSLVVVFIYGSMIWYIFPIKEDISWEGHLAGFATGLLLALAIKVKLPLERKYEWEREDYSEDNDPFLKHFDENGNFIENRDEEGEGTVEVRYHYRPDKKD